MISIGVAMNGQCSAPITEIVNGVHNIERIGTRGAQVGSHRWCLSGILREDEVQRGRCGADSRNAALEGDCIIPAGGTVNLIRTQSPKTCLRSGSGKRFFVNKCFRVPLTDGNSRSVGRSSRVPAEWGCGCVLRVCQCREPLRQDFFLKREYTVLYSGLVSCSCRKFWKGKNLPWLC